MYEDTQGLYDTIIAKAAHHEINPAKIAVIDYQLPVNSKSWWWRPESPDDGEDVYVKNIDLIAGNDDVLSVFVESLAASIQFPRSTAFLHGLGVVASAMTERFFYSFNGGQENTVALYTVGAQPPSTGKSAIDSYLTAPVHKAYKELNERNAVVRAQIEHKIGKAKAAMKKAGDTEQLAIIEDVVALEKELAEHPIYVWAVNDPTPEGCEKVLAAQGGFFNVVSDESSAIQVILGMVYSDKAAKNNGVFLKAWDNGYLAVTRGGRDGFVGQIRGSMAVLAQDASVDAILRAGSNGEGISERFLIIREPNLLGYRNHELYKPVSREAIDAYAHTVHKIVSHPWRVVLELSRGAEDLVRNVKQDQEPLMKDGGKFSTPMLRGVVGKNEKQIIKLACVFHALKEWGPDGSKDKVIQADSVMRAVMTFNQLLKTYVAAADSKGYTGHQTELACIIEALRRFAGKNKLVTDLRGLRDAIKNHKALCSVPKLTQRLREQYLPSLEATGHVVYEPTNETVHINPYLKD